MLARDYPTKGSAGPNQKLSMISVPSSSMSASLALAPDCIDSRHDREHVRVALGLADRYEPIEIAGRYRLLRRIARGSTGSVYLAEDSRLGRRVAIKVVNARIVANERLRERLLDEAKALAHVRHENVLVVYDIGEIEGGERFIAMDHVDGTTMRRWQRGRPLARVLAAYREAGRGLAAAHRAGIVHRDFKSDNVFVSERDGGLRVVVGDFGLAECVLESGLDDASPSSSGIHAMRSPGLGTPDYMSPEQHGGEASPACDQYAFCVSLWEAACGTRPFLGPRRRSDGHPPRPSGIPRWLYRELCKGIEWQPEHRHPDMDVLLARLARGPSRVPLMVIGALVGTGALVGIVLTTAPSTHSKSGFVELATALDFPRMPEIDTGEAPELSPIDARPQPASLGAPQTRENRALERSCERDSLRSVLSERGHSCRGQLQVEIDARGIVVAPNDPILHGRRVPGVHRACTMRVKCPDDHY